MLTIDGDVRHFQIYLVNIRYAYFYISNLVEIIRVICRPTVNLCSVSYQNFLDMKNRIEVLVKSDLILFFKPNSGGQLLLYGCAKRNLR